MKTKPIARRKPRAQRATRYATRTKSNGSTITFDLVPAPRVPPLLVEPIDAYELARLVHAARNASVALDRFVQLHEPNHTDVNALETLNAALAPYVQYRANSHTAQ